MAPGYHKDIVTLLAYYGGEWDDSRAVIRCIRPVLEGYLRMSYPGSFAENEWIGGMIVKIENCTAADPLFSAKGHLSDLESLNDYTKRYHHDDNSPKQGAGPIQDAELQQFTKLTLQLIGRVGA